MTKVTANLGLDEGIYSIDSLLSRVNITEVIDADEAARKQAMLDNGEEYTEEPTTYIVSFVAKKNEGMGFARLVLDEIISIYYSEFGEKYLNSSSTVNALTDIYNEHYDYIEMMDLIDENINETMQATTAVVEQSVFSALPIPAFPLPTLPTNSIICRIPR